MNPLISLILTNYDNYEDTIECVHSLKKIDYSNYNIIVIDNGSVNPNKEAINFLKTNAQYYSIKEKACPKKRVK